MSSIFMRTNSPMVGAVARFRENIPACLGVRPPFLLLHFEQQAKVFSQVVLPPWDSGVMWSTVSSEARLRSPQY